MPKRFPAIRAPPASPLPPLPAPPPALRNSRHTSCCPSLPAPLRPVSHPGSSPRHIKPVGNSRRGSIFTRMMEAPINPGALWGWPAISGHHRGCHPGHPLPAQHRHRHRHRYPLPTRVSKGLPVPTPHDASCGSEGPGGAGAHSTTDSDGDDPAAAASHCPSPPQLPTPTPPTASSDGEDAAAPSSCDAPSASALNGLAVSASLETVAVSWDDVTRHYSAGRNPAPSSSWAAYIRAGINSE